MGKSASQKRKPSQYIQPIAHSADENTRKEQVMNKVPHIGPHHVIFFDTETTGTPKNYKAAMTDLDNWPRIIQLAWAVYEVETQELIASACDLIKPDGWKIPKEKFWIENGYSTEGNELSGIPMYEALDKFIFAYDQCSALIAHNITFDHPIVGAEMIRYGKRVNKKLPQSCTMQSTIDFCALPGRYGYKYPRLIELHEKLFKEGFDGAHDAMADVLACARCYFELKKRGILC